MAPRSRWLTQDIPAPLEVQVAQQVQLRRGLLANVRQEGCMAARLVVVLCLLYSPRNISSVKQRSPCFSGLAHLGRKGLQSDL